LSTTPAAVPTAGNLEPGELALNNADGKLFYEDSAGVVQVLATKAGASGTVTSVDVSGGTTGLTTSGGPVTSSGTITLAGTLAATNGGTGQTTYTNGQLLIGNTTGNTLTKATLTAGTGVSITNGTGSITIAATGLGGDVVGPASATDNAIARYDGTTGKLIQNSAVTIADDGATVIDVNSTSAGLRITQLGSGNALLVEDSANPDSTPVVIDSSGRGIFGHTNFVQVNTYSNFEPISVFGTGSIGVQIGDFGANQFAGGINFAKSRSGTVGTGTVVNSGDALGNIIFNGYDGANYRQAASIVAAVDGTPGTNDMPGRLVFLTTADGASSPTEAFRVTNSKNTIFGRTYSSGERIGIGGSTSVLTSGTSAAGVYNDTVVSSAQTVAYTANSTFTSTQATAFTLSNLVHYSANQNTLGAGSTVTNQFGFAANGGLTGATNNYGFYSNIASGTGRWNFYAQGTAENYLAGNLKVGDTAARGTTAGTSHLSIFNGTAPAGTLTNGITLYSASGDFNFMDSSGNGYQVGFRNIPQNSQSAAYTLVLADSGKHIFHPSADTTARTFTIPANGSVAFPIGTAVTFINQNGAGVVTIAITTDTMRLAGAGTTGSRTLAANGIATAIKITSTEWIISGTGLT
jgi:hypothetical protein